MFLKNKHVPFETKERLQKKTKICINPNTKPIRSNNNYDTYKKDKIIIKKDLLPEPMKIRKTIITRGKKRVEKWKEKSPPTKPIERRFVE